MPLQKIFYAKDIADIHRWSRRYWLSAEARHHLSVIAIIGIILLIGIVKKNGIMLVDFAQQVEHSEGLTAEESIYRACVLPRLCSGAYR